MDFIINNNIYNHDILLIKASPGDENVTTFKAEVPTVMFLDLTATQLTFLTLGLRNQDSSYCELVQAQNFASHF